MKDVLLQQAIKLNRRHKQRAWWKKLVRTMGMAVVFCTTYALILPAITMEQETICTMQAHSHGESCYAQQVVSAWNCTAADGVIHSHGELCFDDQGTCVCPLTERLEHIHGDDCYGLSPEPGCEYVHVHSAECEATEWILTCGQEEAGEHLHTDSCTKKPVLVCSLEESAGHVHGDTCASFQQTLICTGGEEHTHEEACYAVAERPCGIPETEGHTHGEGCYQMEEVACTVETLPVHKHEDACYTQQKVPCEAVAEGDHVHQDSCYEKQLICTLEECTAHSHEETCYDEEAELICQQPELAVHVHTESCLTQTEESRLICQLEEHTHTDVCYPAQEQVSDYTCGLGVHAHLEDCYNSKGELLCTIPAHIHEAACIRKDVDLTADVETERDWTETFAAVPMTGSWPGDVLNLAKSQLHYQESSSNVVLTKDVLKGYTRYGAWYGDPYADWNTLFAAFCLHYAGVEEFPVDTDPGAWADQLAQAQLYQTPDAYSPKPGDLVFLDMDRSAENPVPDRIGILADVLEASEEAPACVRLIEGDYDGKVGYVTYELADPALVGYGQMPAGNVQIKTYAGADYTVTVTYGPEAALPRNVELVVREILPDTEEYEMYYRQSMEALMAGEPEGAQAPEASFARFFDISFVADGVETEPAAPVDIQIRYSQGIDISEEEQGSAIHFADDGVEVLQADTFRTEDPNKKANVFTDLMAAISGEDDRVNTFRFTQDSFSVTGTVVTSTRAVTITATQIEPPQIDNTANKRYVLYTQINGRYYAISGVEQNNRPVEVTVKGNVVTLPADNPSNLLWTFLDGDNDLHYWYKEIRNVGTGRYLHPFNNGGSNKGVTTGGAYAAQLVDVQNNSFRVKTDNGVYVRFRSEWEASEVTSNAYEATYFFVAEVSGSVGNTYNVWFDGTLGGMMNYYGAANENRPVISGENGVATVELPETWNSSTKYDYVLRGWYDIKNHTYYPVNPNDNVAVTVNITGDTVFYADWIAATYDVGADNEHVVDSLDTSDFITTYVFDYNALFNVMSQSHTGSVSASNHAETWTIYNNGETVPYKNAKSLGFAFVDYDNNGEFSYANNRDNTNTNQSGITPGILDEVRRNSGQDLLDLLFSPDRDVIGKYYVGTGNYLFQYMDSTTSNYDGEHDGYYYLDARLNAASYNQSQERFYLYDYLERTSDSRKDGGAGEYSDLLPFNSPYIFEAHQLDNYTDTVAKPGYEYDAKDGGNNHPEHNSLDDANTNYFFGLRTDIEFFLPNDTNTQDEYGNYGNISTRGEHMIFDFHGDDDVWVFIDDKLVLDIGGLHGIMHGRIDFSTGTIAYGPDGKENISTFSMEEGTHRMTVYYMERGSSQSNCAIYFNIAPRYDLEITKEDVVTADKLDGARFSIFDDEAMTDPSELWNSFAEHEAGAEATNTFTVVDGVAKCWGISAGKTYYIYETTPPPGYPASDDMIRITLNNRGTATIETTTLHGQNGVATEGFAVIRQEVNDTLKVVALTVTNQKEGDTTEVRVEKTWDANATNLPQYITVYLTADGERVGRSARLTEASGWSYTWTGLPKYRDNGIDEEVVYVVEEVFVPDFITVQGASETVVDYVDWVRTDQMSDSKTFLLVHNGKALSYDGSSFGWIDRTAAESASSLSAQWTVTTDHDGFHLKNGLGYTLTYSSRGFYGVNDDTENLNQVFYYLSSRLMVHDHDVYYQFGTNGSVVLEDGLAFQLYQKETLTGMLTNIVNRPVDEEKQTFVEVSKIWGDGQELHENDSVKILLYADGKDTGRFVTLNAANNWKGSFDDLPYYQTDDTTVIEYTVVEEKLNSYVPSYSDGEALQGRPVSFWQNVTSLTAGNDVYRIYANGYSLAVASDNDAAAIPNDLEDTTQQWRVVNRYNNLILQNVATGRYLRVLNSDLTTTSRQSEASYVRMTDGLIIVGELYLEIGSGYAGVTASASNVHKESFRVTRWTNSTGKAGIGYTVINRRAIYELPQTGGTGTNPLYTFGSLLTLAAVIMYINKFGRKQQRGGKYSR